MLVFEEEIKIKKARRWKWSQRLCSLDPASLCVHLGYLCPSGISLPIPLCPSGTSVPIWDICAHPSVPIPLYPPGTSVPIICAHLGHLSPSLCAHHSEGCISQTHLVKNPGCNLDPLLEANKFVHNGKFPHIRKEITSAKNSLGSVCIVGLRDCCKTSAEPKGTPFLVLWVWLEFSRKWDTK